METTYDRMSVMEILLGLCYALFGVTLGLQLGTAISPQFDWAGAGNRGFLRLVAERRLDVWNILEMWYGVAMLVFLGTAAVFLSLFTLWNLRSCSKACPSIRMSFSSLFRETGLMIVAALFPFLAFHLARLILSVIPAIDPEMSRQREYLETLKTTTASWAFRSTSLPNLAEQLITLSLSYVLIYLGLLELFSNLPLTRGMHRTLRRILSFLIAFSKWFQQQIVRHWKGFHKRTLHASHRIIKYVSCLSEGVYL